MEKLGKVSLLIYSAQRFLTPICNFLFPYKIRESVQKFNYRNNLTDWKLWNIWLFTTLQKYKKIIQGVLKIKIRWPLQKYNMMRAFKFHRLNVPKSLMFSLLMATRPSGYCSWCSASFWQQRALWHCWQRISSWCTALASPSQEGNVLFPWRVVIEYLKGSSCS